MSAFAGVQAQLYLPTLNWSMNNPIMCSKEEGERDATQLESRMMMYGEEGSQRCQTSREWKVNMQLFAGMVKGF